MSRSMYFAGSWYPSSRKECIDFIQTSYSESKNSSLSCIVPHAGWYFSGALACRTIALMKKDPDLLVIAGGHLAENSPFLHWENEHIETVVGDFTCDLEFLTQFGKQFQGTDNKKPDNTIELNLVFAKYFFPESKIACLRIPPDSRAITAGRWIYEYGKKTGKSICVLGSTDLTHYGSDYNYEPFGTANASIVNKVHEQFDEPFIANLLHYRADEALSQTAKNRSACSAGAAVTAMEFARVSGCNHSGCVGWLSSFDTRRAGSFVDYAGLVFGKE